MKEISCKALKSGKLRVTVDVDPNEKLIAVRNNCFYRLGYPLEEVVHAHTLENSKQVTWCSIQQRWDT